MILSALVITVHLFSLYSRIFESKAKVKSLAVFTLIALILNIILNYFLIKNFLILSQEYAIIGAGIATVVSRVFLLSILVIIGKKQLNLKLNKATYIIKSLIAGFIMALFLIIYNYYFEMNIFMGILEIILGTIIYFLILFLLKEIKKEDIILLRYLFKK